MTRLLYVRECSHGKTPGIIAVPEGSVFTDPACRYQNGNSRPHIALTTYYRDATGEDMFTPKIPRKPRSDKGVPRQRRTT